MLMRDNKVFSSVMNYVETNIATNFNAKEKSYFRHFSLFIGFGIAGTWHILKSMLFFSNCLPEGSLFYFNLTNLQGEKRNAIMLLHTA